jgi:hypothetical protein
MTRKKETSTDFEGKTLEERRKDSMARIAVYVAEAKTAMRDEIAKKVIVGICAGDWKLDLSDGKTWDEVAAKRAYEIADAMLKEREISNV